MSSEKNYYGIGAQFPTEKALLDCRQKIKGEIGQVSLLHLANLPHHGASKDHPDVEQFLLAITPSAAKTEQVIERFKEHGGKPWEPPDDIVAKAIARRQRLGLEALAEGKDELNQQESFGEGAMLNEDGSVSPYHPERGEIEVNLVADAREVDPDSPEAQEGMQALCHEAMVALKMRAKHEGYGNIGALIIAVEDESKEDVAAGIAVESKEEHGGLRLAVAAAQVMAEQDNVPMDFELRGRKGKR